MLCSRLALKREAAARPRCALGFHGTVKARLVDVQAPLPGHIGGQVGREAIRVVQLEHDVARDRRVA